MEQPHTAMNDDTGVYVERPYVAPPTPVLRSDSTVDNGEYVAVYVQAAAQQVSLVTIAAPDAMSELARRANTIIDGAFTAVESSTSS